MVFIVKCSPTSSDNGVRPDKVRMVQRTADTAFVDFEKGIDAVEEDSAIVIMWHKPINQPDIDRYIIYRSTDPEGLVNFVQLNNTSLTYDDTVYTDRNLNLETLYSYFVTAINEDGKESFPSDTVFYELIEKPILQIPADEAVVQDPAEIVFKGIFTNGIASSAILRIERIVGSNFKELIYIEHKIDFDNVYDGTIQFILNKDKLKSLFESNVSYTWRIDLVRDLSYWGSESSNRTFRIIWGS